MAHRFWQQQRRLADLGMSAVSPCRCRLWLADSEQEWQHQLRSSLHPAIFGLAYKAVHGIMAFMDLYLPFRAFILVALPGVLQSVFAALGDFFTWKLAMDIYGRESNAPWAAVSFDISLALLLSICNPRY